MGWGGYLEKPVLPDHSRCMCTNSATASQPSRRLGGTLQRCRCRSCGRSPGSGERAGARRCSGGGVALPVALAATSSTGSLPCHLLRSTAMASEAAGRALHRVRE